MGVDAYVKRQNSFLRPCWYTYWMSHDRIILRTGGQSGVDRACLDSAVASGVRYEGWCPQGGWAEDMTEPPGLLRRYPHMRETLPGNPHIEEIIALFPELRDKPFDGPDIRTVTNVFDSDVVVTLTLASALADGTGLGSAAADRLGKPECVVLLDDPEQALRQTLDFLSRLPGGTTVDINGPRESSVEGGVYEAALKLLNDALRQLREMPVSSLEALDLEMVTHLGGQTHPFVSGIYDPDDVEHERCYSLRESASLQAAKDQHQSMLSLWLEPQIGVCLDCQGQGWLVDEENYCRAQCSGNPPVCAECQVSDPCPEHPTFSAQDEY